MDHLKAFVFLLTALVIGAFRTLKLMRHRYFNRCHAHGGKKGDGSVVKKAPTSFSDIIVPSPDSADLSIP
jgi:hypothetical protein